MVSSYSTLTPWAIGFFQTCKCLGMITAIVLYCRKQNVANFAVISPASLETHTVIINISPLAFIFSSPIPQKWFMFGMCVQFGSAFQVTNFISLISFWLYSSSDILISFFFQVINFIFMLSWYSLLQEYKSMLKSTVCLTIWRWEARTSLHSLTLKERRKLLLTCVGIHAKLKQKKRMKHSSIEWRSNSPMSHDIFCMILDLRRRTAGELISWHSSSGEWGCSLYF